MKIALIQMHVETEIQKNLETAEKFVEMAAKQGADFAVLPEMFCCPYATENFPLYAQPQGGQVWTALSHMASKNKLYLVGGTMPEGDEQGKVYNTSFVFDRQGKQIARHRKMHLFDIQITGGQCFQESLTLTAGNEVTVFDTEFGKIGLCICYDIRFPELGRLMALEGAKLVVVPAAFNMTTGPAHWELAFKSRALDNQMFYVGVAPARQVNSNYVSYGNSIVTDPWGQVIQRLEEKEALCLCDIDFSRSETIRQELPLLKHLRKDIYELKLL